MSTVPLWVAVVISVGSPLLGFGGVLLGQLVIRRTATEADTRWRREETMRLLRWAADHAVDHDLRRARLGLVTLQALGSSRLLQVEDEHLVAAVLRLALRQRYDESHAPGGHG
jgi:hypothetical protein